MPEMETETSGDYKLSNIHKYQIHKNVSVVLSNSCADVQ